MVFPLSNVFMFIKFITEMGYRKFQLARRKNAEHKRLKNRLLKSSGGRPSKRKNPPVDINAEKVHKMFINNNIC